MKLTLPSIAVGLLIIVKYCEKYNKLKIFSVKGNIFKHLKSDVQFSVNRDDEKHLMEDHFENGLMSKNNSFIIQTI